MRATRTVILKFMGILDRMIIISKKNKPEYFYPGGFYESGVNFKGVR